MNVFVIPSWYPHRCHPLDGIFFQDQALAYGELRPDSSVALSLWGQGLARVSLAHLRSSPQCMLDALRGPGAATRALAGNVREYTGRAFTWDERFQHGNREGILRVNRRNLERARRDRGRIDVIHAHVSYPAGWVAMRLSAEFGIPYVVTEHMGPFPLPVYETADGSLAEFIREPLERASARIAVSRVLAERIASFGIGEPEVVPNLVDERAFTGEPHGPRDRFVFFTLGGMVPVKGFPDLIHAIAAFMQKVSPHDRERVEFRLAGYGPCLEEYQALARQLGIDASIRWPGFLARDRAREAFRSSDCYVMSSLHESFGIVLVESIAAGRPVIATRCGGPDDIVTEQNGILVPVGQPADLAEAMLAVFQGRRTFDARAMRDEILGQYSRAAVVDRLEAIYRRAIA